MDELENLVDRCVAKGYHPTLRRHPTKWECELNCGVDTLSTEKPRPLAYGATAVEALKAAMLKVAEGK